MSCRYCDVGDFERRQDDAATALEIRLKQPRELVERRRLLVPLHSVTFAPGSSVLPESEAGHHVADNASLAPLLESLSWESADDELYRQIIKTVATGHSDYGRDAEHRMTGYNLAATLSTVLTSP